MRATRGRAAAMSYADRVLRSAQPGTRLVPSSSNRRETVARVDETGRCVRRESATRICRRSLRDPLCDGGFPSNASAGHGVRTRSPRDWRCVLAIRSTGESSSYYGSAVARPQAAPRPRGWRPSGVSFLRPHCGRDRARRLHVAAQEVEVSGVSCVGAGVTESILCGHRSRRSPDPGAAAPPRNSRSEERTRRTGQAPVST
jgi:hypothetical protein